MYNLQVCGLTRSVTLRFGTPDRLSVRLLSRTPIHPPVSVSTLANVPVLTAWLGDDAGSHQVVLAVSGNAAGAELAESFDLFAFEVTPEELDFVQRQMKLPAVCVCRDVGGGEAEGEGPGGPDEAVYIRSHGAFGPGGVDRRDAEIAARVRSGRL